MKFTGLISRASIVSGEELGKGGEGTVYHIQSRPNHVLKVYEKIPAREKGEKLRLMVGARNPSLLQVAAWPIEIALDRSGHVCGFVMPRVSARRDIHELYSPKSRNEYFPEATFAFLLHVSTNIARAFATVHQQGHVVGDVNHGNLLVGPDGIVKFIDCDSFQYEQNGKLYTCDVGVPLFTPPELQDKPFRGLVRTQNQDLFGLAVLLFHMLFMGRHPFAGKYSGKTEMPVEKAIREFRFAYGHQNFLVGMDRPVGTLALTTFGQGISRLFTTAFERRTIHGGRPTAAQWLSELGELENGLVRCGRNGRHLYPKTLASCPWCDLEATFRITLFGKTPSIGDFDLEAIWLKITQVKGPGRDPPLPSEHDVKLPTKLAFRIVLKLARQAVCIIIGLFGLIVGLPMIEEGGLIIVVVFAGMGIGLWPRPNSNKKDEMDEEIRRAKAKWDGLHQRWLKEASHSAFVAAQSDLRETKERLKDFANEGRRRHSELNASQHSRQKERYLRGFRIREAYIEGIGASRTLTLLQNGIHTAADVESWQIRRISGFGPSLTFNLTMWRNQIEQSFRFNPQDPQLRRDSEELESELEKNERALQQKLRLGAQRLNQLRESIHKVRPYMIQALEQSCRELKFAKAKRRALQ